MTSWAKALTVIAFVLSLVFAGMSAVVYAKRVAYQKMYLDEKDLHASDKAADALKIATRDGRISDLTGERDRKAADVAARDKDIETRKAQVDKLTSDLADAKQSLANEQAQVITVTTTNDRLTKDNEGYVTINNNLRTENKDLIGKLSAEQDITRQLQVTVTELQKSRGALQVELAQAKDTLALNEEVFAELSKRNIEARTVIIGWQTMPAIDGLVIAVDPETHAVVLNVGSKQGVRKNFNFTIFRGPDFIAQVNVFNVEEKRCAAQIIASKGPVKVNDAAQTRLHF